MTYALFVNVLERDEESVVRNAKQPENRAAQCIRSYVDAAYVVEPPFEDWETNLYGRGGAAPGALFVPRCRRARSRAARSTPDPLRHSSRRSRRRDLPAASSLTATRACC
ncbi:DUF7677 family protein [Polyangium fumosum]|uniref:DUF7677 domain-containing protein n=1 Tax=Polyangium fumosum TaxID=889272 RepID=A0A4U1J6W9_9BACT|nr:hypothetical protein E8A74_27330 [Polyangium fumosum]